MRSRDPSFVLASRAVLMLLGCAALGCSSEIQTGGSGGSGGAVTSGAGGAGGAAVTSTTTGGGAGGAGVGGAGGAGGGPAECMTAAECPPGYGCACGGPGPGPHPCHCGAPCNIDADCPDAAQPVCCAGTCTDACTCYCD